MRFGQIRSMDIANGLGIRVSLFVTGCRFNCKGCFNREYQDFLHGEVFGREQLELILNYLNHDYISGLTILGGEPFQNEKELLLPVKEVRQFIDDYNSCHGHDQFKNIWIYSGYTFEQICADEYKLELLKLCDVLVDGLFEIDKLDLNLRFRGSSNQRIVDIRSSLIKNSVIEYDLG